MLTLPVDTGSAVTVSQPPEPSAAELQPGSELPGLSSTQAEANLSIQHQGTKVDLVDQLEERLGDTFAGVWFDAAASEFVVPVATAGDGKAATASSKSDVAEEFAAAALQGDYRTEIVDSSHDDLEGAQSALNEELRPYFEAGVVQTALDPRVNAVIVRVPVSIGSVALASIEQTLASTDLEVELVELPDSAFKLSASAGCAEQYRQCDRPLRGGQEIFGMPSPDVNGEPLLACTAGFRANGNDGKKYILTAGHCMKEHGDPNKGMIWNWMVGTSTEGRQYGGTSNQWHFPGKDWARIDATGTWADAAPWPTVLAYWGGPHEYPIVGEAKSYVGQTLCHSGANTATSCGEVIAENVSVTYTDTGAKLNGLFEMTGKNLCIGGGDSGGPIFANNIALGLLSGGTDGCGHQWILFSDLTAATAELNVNIMGPGAPEAITGAATNVQ